MITSRYLKKISEKNIIRSVMMFLYVKLQTCVKQTNYSRDFFQMTNRIHSNHESDTANYFCILDGLLARELRISRRS